VCSDGPWRTPQNLPDPYLRTQRNEPSNIASIAASIAQALRTEDEAKGTAVGETESQAAAEEALVKRMRHNSLTAFQLTGQNGKTSSAIGSAVPNKEITSDNPSNEMVNNLAHKLAAQTLDSSKTHHAPSGKAVKPTSAAPAAFYACVRCRGYLFHQKEVNSHDLSVATTKTVFKVGDQGLCASSLMIAQGAAPQTESTQESGTATGSRRDKDKEKVKEKEKSSSRKDVSGVVSRMEVRGNSVECADCGSKLGKFYAVEATCGCGATIAGNFLLFSLCLYLKKGFGSVREN
jgi:hypothetical protein